MESWFIGRSQLCPSIYSGFSPYAGLQVLTLSTHLLKNPHICIEPTPFQNATSRVAGLKVHATAPRHWMTSKNYFLTATIRFCRTYICLFANQTRKKRNNFTILSVSLVFVKPEVHCPNSEDIGRSIRENSQFFKIEVENWD